MAEVNSNSGEDHGQHGKSRRKGRGNPRIDMTPMVDLAFLLLTFFVLTSNLNQPKVMQMAVPADGPSTLIDDDLANTILIDGNADGKVYVYHGKFKDANLQEYKLDAKNGIRQFMLDQNKEIAGKMKYVRNVYKSGKLDNGSYEKIKAMLAENAGTNAAEDSVVVNRKRKDYQKVMVRLDKDLLKHEMSDTTFRMVSANVRNDDDAPFFIVKWGNDAKYNDVINIIDELKITDNSKYAITRITGPEFQKLSEKTGVKYPELLQTEPAEK